MFFNLLSSLWDRSPPSSLQSPSRHILSYRNLKFTKAKDGFYTNSGKDVYLQCVLHRTSLVDRKIRIEVVALYISPKIRCKDEDVTYKWNTTNAVFDFVGDYTGISAADTLWEALIPMSRRWNWQQKRRKENVSLKKKLARAPLDKESGVRRAFDVNFFFFVVTCPRRHRCQISI